VLSAQACMPVQVGDTRGVHHRGVDFAAPVGGAPCQKHGPPAAPQPVWQPGAVGEQFADADLQAALAGPAINVLLYPQGEQPAAQMPAWAPGLHAPDTPVRLVVLDATWRKSRKMLYLNPLLQCLPRLSLDATLLSRYLIRKAHKPGQLSTLEATCAALAQLERDAPSFLPLLDAFDGFVAHQLAFKAERP
jgi:DTW domain-containing protein YfiP